MAIGSEPAWEETPPPREEACDWEPPTQSLSRVRPRRVRASSLEDHPSRRAKPGRMRSPPKRSRTSGLRIGLFHLSQNGASVRDFVDDAHLWIVLPRVEPPVTSECIVRIGADILG